MQHTPVFFRRGWTRRALSLLLALTLMLGFVPGVPSLESEASAHWADPYLSQLVEWGFIRSDQAGYPDRALTRADFMAIVNRAYGYHELGETPFEDVAEKDWFYDDVGIAYTARYIKGTSPTTASPNNTLTRETAATILGRNMMLQESAGELLDFTDARQISSWARGTIKSSLEHYLVSGYDDGTFRPQRNVSWGEMAAMLTALVGTPLQEEGDYSLGGVFGNVTITSPGVTLRDTVVTGDLYVTGGVGLGDVKLENVTVLGRIIASGTGQSEGGGASILLRNVTADELLVDNLQGNFVTIQADGVTEIGRTTVRTSAYIEDNTPDGMGLKYISLEGETYPEGEEPDDWEPILLQLAGRIEEVVNRTPQSTVQAARGTVAKLTVDETAVDSKVVIDRGAVVKELNLDTGVEVTGEGDIEKLVVNAPGSTVAMLPNQIEIRPGITAVIAGEEMDTVAAEESSMEPQILAGYPQAQDVVPTGLDAVFSTNKAGTVYWAVSAITDGSIGEEDLIKPPSYGNLAVRNGSTKIAKGNEETTAKITGLTPGGSYYLSAVLVDARGNRSATKVISFTTPDNTVPAFNAGYPHMSSIGTGRNPNPDDSDNPGVSQVVVMPNKDCKLYYALLPQGATAPTEAELKSNAVSGALGYGVRDVYKNKEDIFRVHDRTLEEQTTYVLYLWLTDADGVNKGKITSLTFTTADETPPEFIVPPYASKTQATSVTMSFRLDEDGTVYWVAVPAGTRYPMPLLNTPGTTEPLSSPHAKLQVSSGMNIGSDGKSGRTAAKANADGTFNITGLKAETAYDVYYVAQDKAGNYSLSVGKVTISPLDSSGPVFTQSFSNTDNPSDKTKDPLVSTDIYLDISENVQYIGDGQGSGRGFVELYADITNSSGTAREQAINRLASDLYNSIRLKKYDTQNNREQTTDGDYNYVDGQTFKENMLVDYTKVKIQDNRKQGKGIRVIFPSDGLHLEPGGRYCFEITGLYDISTSSDRDPNPQNPDPINFIRNQKGEKHNVPSFDVEFPTVELDIPSLGSARPIARDANGSIPASDAKAVPTATSITFYMRGKSTASVGSEMSYDVLIWSDANITYDLYYRVVRYSDGGSILDNTGAYPASVTIGGETIENYLLPNTSGKEVDENGWIFLKNSGPLDPGAQGENGKTVNQFFAGCDDTTLPKLRDLNENLRYDFVVNLRSKDGISDASYTTWKNRVNFKINVAAGRPENLARYLGDDILRPALWKEAKDQGRRSGAESIGVYTLDNGSTVDTLTAFLPFRVTSIPSFEDDTPEFRAADIQDDNVKIQLSLSSSGTVHYAIAPAGTYDSNEGEGDTPLITTIREITADDYEADGTTLKEGVRPVPGSTDLMYVTLSSPNAPLEGGTSLKYPILDWMKGGTGAEDDPELDNLLESPDRESFTRSWPEGVVSGTFEIDDERGKQGYLVEGLSPETTYFAYFIITPGTGAESDFSHKSHVYIYQFTTPSSDKPKITLRPQTGNGDMWVDLDVGTQSYYLVVSETDANDPDKISILSQEFYPTYSAYTDKTDLDLPEPYKEYTVLQALTTDYSNQFASEGGQLSTSQYYIPGRITGYTVFDMYASERARIQIFQLISSQTLIPPDEACNLTSDDLGPFDMIWTKRPESGLERTKLEIGNRLGSSRYLFLTCAVNRNTLEPEDDGVEPHLKASFRGTVYGKGALSAPDVTGRGGSLQKDKVGDTYSGSVTIYFTPSAYLHQNRAVKITPDNLIDEDLVSCSPSFTVSRTPLGQIRFDITRANLNDSVEFPQNYFANQSNTESPNALTIKVEEREGQKCIAIYWGDMEKPKYIIKESEGSTGSGDALILTGANVAGGATDAPTLDLHRNATTQREAVTAQVVPANPTWSPKSYTWTIISGKDVVAVTDDDKATATIEGLLPGKATVQVTALGVDDNGDTRSATKTLTVTVTGEVTGFGSSSITPTTSTVSQAGNALTVTKAFEDAATVTVPITVANGTLSASAELVVRDVSGTTGELSRSNFSISGGNLILTLPNTMKAGVSHADVTIGLQEKGGSTDLAPEPYRQTLTVNLTVQPEAAPIAAVYSPRKTAAAKPALSLSHVSGAALDGSTVNLKMTSSKTSTIRADITNGTATSITWTSDNTSVATVSPKSGSQATITGKAIGVATITVTAEVNGTTLTKTIAVHVRGTITGLKLTSPTGASSSVKWDSAKKALTLTRGGGTIPTAVFSVTANATISSKTASVVCTFDNGKDASDYVTCTVSAKNTITVTPGTVAPAETQKITVTVKLVSKNGEINLTPETSDKLTFTVQIKGNDAGINISTGSSS